MERHDPSHKDHIVMFKSVKSLPSDILISAKVIDLHWQFSNHDAGLNWISYDFGTLLCNYFDYKKSLHSDQEGDSNQESLIRTTINRLSKCVQITHGLIKVTKLTNWLHGNNQQLD